MEYAEYFWARANENVTDGLMTIRRFKGRRPEIASVNDWLLDGDTVYTAFFKGAVWAYDLRKDESFVVFHPYDIYSWPTLLRKAGDWLLIGTRGEGLVLVNVKTWYLKRTKEVYLNIEQLSVTGNKIIVNESIEFEVTSDDGSISSERE